MAFVMFDDCLLCMLCFLHALFIYIYGIFSSLDEVLKSLCCHPVVGVGVGVGVDVGVGVGVSTHTLIEHYSHTN